MKCSRSTKNAHKILAVGEPAVSTNGWSVGTNPAAREWGVDSLATDTGQIDIRGWIGIGRLGGTTANREDCPYRGKHIGDFNRCFRVRHADDYSLELTLDLADWSQCNRYNLVTTHSLFESIFTHYLECRFRATTNRLDTRCKVL